MYVSAVQQTETTGAAREVAQKSHLGSREVAVVEQTRTFRQQPHKSRGTAKRNQPAGGRVGNFGKQDDIGPESAAAQAGIKKRGVHQMFPVRAASRYCGKFREVAKQGGGAMKRTPERQCFQ